MRTKHNLRKSLLAWYDRAGRDLPWRVKAGRPDPYRIWLSEIMLQQTTVAAVAPYFERFLIRWPDVAALAAAPRDELLAAWAGLGYYARARSLHAAATILAREGLPDTEEGWRVLPGVGPYTAAAIAAIAYDRPANVVDGNVERVLARLHAVEELLPAARAKLRALGAELVADDRPGDYAQALMDLGATICTPKSPKCLLCPWTDDCAARARGDQETFPRKAAKAERPRRYGVAFRLERGPALLLVRRPDKGLLGGMPALPSTPWRAEPWRRGEALAHAPAQVRWRRVGEVEHLFTHFALTLSVWRGVGAPSVSGVWSADADHLPAVFRKAALLAEPKAAARKARAKRA